MNAMLKLDRSGYKSYKNIDSITYNENTVRIISNGDEYVSHNTNPDIIKSIDNKITRFNQTIIELESAIWNSNIGYYEIDISEVK